MASAAPTGEQFDIGRVIAGTAAAIMRNLPVMGGFALAGQLVVAVATAYGTLDMLKTYDPDVPATALNMFTSLGYWLTIAASLIGASFIQAGLFSGFLAEERGESADFSSCLNGALRYFLPMLGLLILWYLGITIGFMLLIVPGVLLVIMWSVCLPALVAEDAGVIGSFGRSRELTKGNRLMVFVALLLFGLFLVFISFAGQGFSSSGLLRLYQSNPLLGVGVATIVGTLTGMLTASFLVALYHELRLVKEGAGGGTGLAEIFA
jgi:hypothetical protein